MQAEISRKTAETDIDLKLDLNGTGKYKIDTGIGFFNHLLELFACHGFLDLVVRACGDLEVDEHHTVEDVGIVLGKALAKALGDKAGLTRYADLTLPMDETLVQVVIDLSGRPYYQDDLVFSREMVGGFPVELMGEFFRSLVYNAGITLHIRMLRGGNIHHLLEGCFKAFGRALGAASRQDSRLGNRVLSSKGTLGSGEVK